MFTRSGIPEDFLPLRETFLTIFYWGITKIWQILKYCLFQLLLAHFLEALLALKHSLITSTLFSYLFHKVRKSLISALCFKPRYLLRIHTLWSECTIQRPSREPPPLLARVLILSCKLVRCFCFQSQNGPIIKSGKSYEVIKIKLLYTNSSFCYLLLGYLIFDVRQKTDIC